MNSNNTFLKLVYIEDFITNFNDEEIYENSLIIFDEYITFLVENLIVFCLIRPFNIKKKGISFKII